MAEASGERAAKLELISNFCLQNGFDLSETIAVGDGGNDLEIFKNTKGVLLGDNAELLPVAWKQIHNLSELVDII
jgi:hydroxymethylpyrimidine pyrophosphatase-like HAD family hydrolase